MSGIHPLIRAVLDQIHPTDIQRYLQSVAQNVAGNVQKPVSNFQRGEAATGGQVNRVMPVAPNPAGGVVQRYKLGSQWGPAPASPAEHLAYIQALQAAHPHWSFRPDQNDPGSLVAIDGRGRAQRSIGPSSGLHGA